MYNPTSISFPGSPQSRRNFLRVSGMAAVAPYLITSSLKGNNAPNNRLHLGAIGLGNRSERVNVQHFTVFGGASAKS